MLALGMIEVYGRVGAIEGLDSALKSANVHLVNMIRVGGGLTSVFIEGDVGAVKAAIDSATAAASEVGGLCSNHVIPRPDKAVRAMLEMKVTVNETVEKKDEHAQSKSPESMTVSRLRALAREVEDFPLSKEEIKFAKKDELLNALNNTKGDVKDNGGKGND